MREVVDYLLAAKDAPEVFLESQKALYRNRPNTGAGNLNGKGLPEKTGFYQGEKEEVPPALCETLPRVLNIGSGPDPERQFDHAINMDLSGVGSPQVIADARNLPFAKGAMTALHASHVLEHFKPDEIPGVLSEWRRVLNPSGVLRVAVPDAEVTFNEIKAGVTDKGMPAIDHENGSGPLTQIYGLGSENKDTDDRWRHHIIFSNALLSWFLHGAGFDDVSEYKEQDSLSAACGIRSDETNHYSLKLEAKESVEPHQRRGAVTAEEYKEMTADFTPEAPLSIIVPVHQERDNLPPFMSHLTRVIQEAPLGEREIIFVVNGTTDGSERLIEEFMTQNPDLNIKMTHSEQGILNAFIEGVKEKELDGFVCKLDVDTQPHLYSLGVLYMGLSRGNHEVVYAEPYPGEDLNCYNFGEHFGEFRTQRQFIHGRFSMYRQNPFELFDEQAIRDTGAAVEDIILSSAYSYYFGIDSIGVAPGAVVQSPSPTSFEQVAHQRKRIRREVRKINEKFPYFKILKKPLGRSPVLPEEGDVSENANQRNYYYHLTKALSYLAKIDCDSNPTYSYRNNGDL